MEIKFVKQEDIRSYEENSNEVEDNFIMHQEDMYYIKNLVGNEILFSWPGVIEDCENAYDKIYRYDIISGKMEEILPDIEKYNGIWIYDLANQNSKVYYCTSNRQDGKKETISFVCYDLLTKAIDVLFEKIVTINKYNSMKKMIIYVLDEDNFIIQEEHQLENNSESNSCAIGEFNIYIYSVKNKESYHINDERIKQNGIQTLYQTSNGTLIIKTGMITGDLLWQNFKKSTAPNEYIFMVDKALFLESIKSNERIVPMTILEHCCWDKSITYLEIDVHWIIYLKKNCLPGNVEIYAYNIDTGSQYCYTPKKDEFNIKFVIVNQLPYAILFDFNTTLIKCLLENAGSSDCEVSFSIEDIVFEIIILQEFDIDNMDNVVSLYHYPDMKLLKSTKGSYGQSFKHNGYLVCTII